MCFEGKRMKNVNKEILKKAANSLMFDMSDEQYDKLEKEFEIILKQLDVISHVKGVDEISPMTFPFDNSITYLRKDVAGTPLNQREALKNSKDTLLGQIKLPKVI